MFFDTLDFSHAHADVLLLYGTVTGNAELVAEDVGHYLGDAGFTVHLLDMADALPETLQDFTQVIICTSSWGDGELPDNAIDLYEGLTAYRPDLSHVHYGVIGLGDRIYEPHFCGGAKRIDELFSDLGAITALKRFEIDAGPTDRDIQEACRWSLRCAVQFSTAMAGSTAA